jgi:hypothetical protein
MEKTAKEPIVRLCDACGSKFRYGPDRYDGRWLRGFQMLICMSCFNGNLDGWNVASEPRVRAHLASKGIAVPGRNDKGLLPRGD